MVAASLRSYAVQKAASRYCCSTLMKQPFENSMAKPLRAIRRWIGELFSGSMDDHDERWSDRDVMIVAHRGAAFQEPENTIPALTLALDRFKCTAIEIDLSFTRDGEVVLWHDWSPGDAIALARQSGFEAGVRCRPFAPGLGSVWRRAVRELDL